MGNGHPWAGRTCVNGGPGELEEKRKCMQALMNG